VLLEHAILLLPEFVDILSLLGRAVPLYRGDSGVLLRPDVKDEAPSGCSKQA
jgi:hypothetical protein